MCSVMFSQTTIDDDLGFFTKTNIDKEKRDEGFRRDIVSNSIRNLLVDRKGTKKKFANKNSERGKKIQTNYKLE